MTIENILEELFEGYYPVSEFCASYIKNKQDEEEIRETFDFLIGLGIKKERLRFYEEFSLNSEAEFTFPSKFNRKLGYY